MPDEISHSSHKLIPTLVPEKDGYRQQKVWEDLHGRLRDPRDGSAKRSFSFLKTIVVGRRRFEGL